MNLADYICKNLRCLHEVKDVKNEGEIRECPKCTKVMRKIYAPLNSIDKTGMFAGGSGKG